jgi:hypothetical protein
MKQQHPPQLSTAAAVLFFLLSFLLFAALDPTPKTTGAGPHPATSNKNIAR